MKEPPHSTRRVLKHGHGDEGKPKGTVRHTARGRTPGSDVPDVRGISLRWKIMMAMAGVTVTAAVLIFVVVYAKTVDQLNNEIDAKGERLTYVLASIDSHYWIHAINMRQSEGVRQTRLDGLIVKAFPHWSEIKRKVFGRDAVLKIQYEDLIKESIGTEKVKSARELIQHVTRRIKDDPDLGKLVSADFEQVVARAVTDLEWKRQLDLLLNPLPVSITPLQAGGISLSDGGDIVQIAVQNVSQGTDGSMNVSARPTLVRLGNEVLNKHLLGDITITDRNAFEGEGSQVPIPSRSFTMERSYDDVKLRFWVLLSLNRINEAKSQLRTTIFLPTLLSVLLGLAIAWLLSQRITEPVKILMNDINEVSRGNLDHETVSHSSDEIGMLATSFNHMTGALRTAHDAEIEAKAMEHELGIAAEIQANLVPKKVLKLPGYDISAYYRPSKEVGGDYYDFIDIDEEHVGIIVADVSGKGVPGSLVMSMARAFVRMEAERSKNISPSSTLVNVNRMLAADIKKGMFVTAVYAVMNKRLNEMRVASAGHNPMIVWRQSTNQVDLVNPKGIALGFDKGPVFERTISEETIKLAKGDRLVLYTDGSVEAMDADGQEFGDEKFYAMCAQLGPRDSNQFLNMIVKALDAHKGDAPQHDDQTIVTLRFMGIDGQPG